MKYDPLRRYLEGRADATLIQLTFAEIDAILGFPLPRSARDHQAWWSNTRIGHSHAAAWLDPGWKTAGLDLAARQVSFLRASGPATGVAEERAPFARDGAAISFPVEALGERAVRMLDDHVKTHGGDRRDACLALLDQLANDRLAAMVEWFQNASPPLPAGVDVVDLIREDRDAR